MLHTYTHIHTHTHTRTHTYTHGHRGTCTLTSPSIRLTKKANSQQREQNVQRLFAQVMHVQLKGDSSTEKKEGVRHGDEVGAFTPQLVQRPPCKRHKGNTHHDALNKSCCRAASASQIKCAVLLTKKVSEAGMAQRESVCVCVCLSVCLSVLCVKGGQTATVE